MKRKTAAAAVYASAIIMFAVFLASALAPPVMGGLSVEGTDRHDVSTDGKNINVEWGVAIESSLPYRINDVNISVKVGGGRGITIAEAGFDVKNGTTTKNLSGKLPTITALLLATGGDSKKGVYVPLDFEIRGSYPFSLFTLDMNIQALVKLSDAGTVEADWSDDRVTVTASGIGGNVMSNIDPFIGGVSGSDISVKITKTAGRVVLDMRSTSGDLIESLESARDENGGLRIDVQGGRDPIILDGSEVEGIINVIKRGIGP